MMRRHLLIVALAASSPFGAGAQGALSLQGFGYPPGQFSARALATGGGIAEFDALSPVNPASLASVGAAAVFFQYDPEFRRVTAGGRSSSTTTARFSVVGATLPVSSEWTLGLSSSTFLDRSSETRSVRQLPVGGDGDITEVTQRSRILGAINDLRVAVGYAPGQSVRFGFGAHALVGSNRISLDELLPDSSQFTSSTQRSNVSFAGFAGSAGIIWQPSRLLGVSLSTRLGGDLIAKVADTTIGRGGIPDHYAAAVRYDGLTGAILSARIARDNWSSLKSFGGSSVTAFDGWDIGGGAEAVGPRFMSRVVSLRAGARYRTLPFGLNGAEVKETGFTGGFGVPLSRDRANFDFTAQRLTRSSGGDIRERAFIFSFGLRVTP